MSLPLSDTLSFNTETFLTWSDRHDMMASFGVTPEKAARTLFRAHRAGGGARGDRAVGAGLAVHAATEVLGWRPRDRTDGCGGEKQPSRGEKRLGRAVHERHVPLLRASDSCSFMKSIDQHSLLLSGTASGSGLSRFSRFFGLIHMFRDNPQ